MTHTIFETHAGKMGPVIDSDSLNKILGYIEASEKEGAKILLDGRSWISKMENDEQFGKGYWIGPTIICHKNKTDKAMNEEVFGPVLSVYHVSTWHEAIEIENANPFGNAAAIYTNNGGYAEWFLTRVRASVSMSLFASCSCYVFFSFSQTSASFSDFSIMICALLIKMLGVNIGIPVPREPFSFGGLYGTKSKFGDMDITG